MTRLCTPAPFTSSLVHSPRTTIIYDLMPAVLSDPPTNYEAALAAVYDRCVVDHFGELMVDGELHEAEAAQVVKWRLHMNAVFAAIGPARASTPPLIARTTGLPDSANTQAQAQATSLEQALAAIISQELAVAVAPLIDQLNNIQERMTALGY